MTARLTTLAATLLIVVASATTPALEPPQPGKAEQDLKQRAEKRSAAWKTILKAREGKTERIQAYAESPDIDYICFHCDLDGPYLFDAKKGTIDSVVLPGAIHRGTNSITYEKRGDTTVFVFWHIGHEEATINPLKFEAGSK